MDLLLHCHVTNHGLNKCSQVIPVTKAVTNNNILIKFYLDLFFKLKMTATHNSNNAFKLFFK